MTLFSKYPRLAATSRVRCDRMPMKVAVTTRRGEEVAKEGGRPSWRTEEDRRGRGGDTSRKKGQEPLTNYATSSQLHKPASGYLYATRLPISGLTSTWLTTVHCRPVVSLAPSSRFRVLPPPYRHRHLLLSLSLFLLLLLLLSVYFFLFTPFSCRNSSIFTSPSSPRWRMCDRRGVATPVGPRLFTCMPSDVRGLEMRGPIRVRTFRRWSGNRRRDRTMDARALWINL